MANEQELDTGLSPSVKNLLCTIGIGLWTEDDADPTQAISLNEYALLNIEGCVKNILSAEDSSKDSVYYARATSKLSHVFRECEQLWSLIDVEELTVKCKQYLSWTGNVQLFQDCFHILKQKQENRDILALLLLCTGIEQTFRKIFAYENVPCPLLLKDILASKELIKCLGHDAIQLFQIMMGPPTSMNLRNVAWHGFLSEGELSPSYGYFLLVLMSSLNPQISYRAIDLCSVKSATNVDLSKVDDIFKSFSDFSDDDMVIKVKDYVASSWMARKRNTGLIKDVFDLHLKGKYGWSSVQGLPILEHALRRWFVKENNCMQRLITAEATTLYTTYEEILDCYLPDGTDNQLVPALGESFMDLLHDLLVYPNGPRARDRLGHGETDVYTTSSSLSSLIIICLGYLAIRGGDDDLNKTKCHSCIENLVAWVESYESQFHPVAELKHKIESLSVRSTQTYKCLRTDPDLQPANPKSHPEIFIQENPSFREMLTSLNDILNLLDKQNSSQWNFSLMKSTLNIPFGSVHNLIEEDFNKRVSTLHRWQKKEKCPQSNVTESEMIGLLHRCVDEMETVHSHVVQTLQLKQEALDNRQLRSRQRDNLKRLILFVPSLILATNYQTLLWTWLLNLLNHQDRLQPAHFKRIHKYLKSVLQMVENLRTYTSSDHNKWTKAEEVLVSWGKAGVELVKQLHTS